MNTLNLKPDPSPAAVVAVVLAAGQSSRMGRAKQIEVVDGEPMVVRAVRTALQSDAAQVMVVTGAYAEAVTAVLDPCLHEVGSRLRLIHNPDWQTGQASSIRTAIQTLSSPRQGGAEQGFDVRLRVSRVPSGCELSAEQMRVNAVLFLPTDQPFVPPALLQQLIHTWRAGARLVAPLVDGQIRGAPALFDRSLWPELLALQGDVGARPLLQKYRAEIVTIPTPAHLLRDIDTPQDLV